MSSPVLLIPLILVGLAMVPVAVIDARSRIIPNVITYPLILFGLAFSFVPGGITPLESLLGMLAGGGFLLVSGLITEKILKKEGIGGGDVKLMAAVGACMGPVPAFLTLFAGSLLSMPVLLVQRMMGKQFFGREIPFGPYLAVGFYVAMAVVIRLHL